MSEANTKHTPGPWTVDDDGEGLFITMDALVGKDESLPVYASPDPEQRLADAYLIAAAPLLLTALEGLVGLIRDGHLISPSGLSEIELTNIAQACLDAESTVKKARGES